METQTACRNTPTLLITTTLELDQTKSDDPRMVAIIANGRMDEAKRARKVTLSRADGFPLTLQSMTSIKLALPNALMGGQGDGESLMTETCKVLIKRIDAPSIKLKSETKPSEKKE